MAYDPDVLPKYNPTPTDTRWFGGTPMERGAISDSLRGSEWMKGSSLNPNPPTWVRSRPTSTTLASSTAPVPALVPTSTPSTFNAEEYKRDKMKNLPPINGGSSFIVPSASEQASNRAAGTPMPVFGAPGSGTIVPLSGDQAPKGGISRSQSSDYSQRPYSGYSPATGGVGAMAGVLESSTGKRQIVPGSEDSYQHMLAAQTEHQKLANEGGIGVERMRGETATREQAALDRNRAAEREFKRPEQEAQIGALGAQQKLYESQAAGVTTGNANKAQQQEIIEALSDTKKYPEGSAGRGRLVAKYRLLRSAHGEVAEDTTQSGIDKYVISQGVHPRTYQPLIPVVRKATGGVIEGFADGGAVGREQPSIQQVHPMVAQYGQYLSEAAKAGVAPIPFAQYTSLLQSRNAAPEAHFADGGDVSALGRPLKGPGTGTSDSIPAVIDGSQPAALSKGEYVLDEATVRYYGTKFLDNLRAKAKEPAEGAPA